MPAPQRLTLLIGAAATVASNLPVFLAGALATQLADDLGFGRAALGGAVGAFFGAMAVTSPTLGRVADRWGSTASLRVALCGAAVVGLAIALLATDWARLAALLALSGTAAALVQPAANRLLIGGVDRSRLGTAFGVKQSAPPVASMLAGLSVPAVALTVGWRWAYVLAAGAMGAVALAVRAGRGQRTVPRLTRDRPPPLANRPVLLFLALAFGLATAANSVVIAFSVDSTVQAGASLSIAGYVFAAASALAVATRLLAGLICDRSSLPPLQLCAGLLGTGAVGLVLLASNRPTLMAAGVVVGLAGTWGFPGVFWFALVRAYPDAPGRITGAMAPAIVGGLIGPVAFGGLASATTYATAWWAASGVALLAAIAMALGERRLPSTTG